MIDWLRNVPDSRNCKKIRHELAEVFFCLIIGLLTGHDKLRRIFQWCNSNIDELRKYLPFSNGIPSVPTMSRVLSSVDEGLVACAMMNWMGSICNPQGTHVAIDGKGLRSSASKVRSEKTAYALNAIDVATKLVIGHLAIPEKKGEGTSIPELLDMLNISGCIVSVDAIGTTEGIMNAIKSKECDYFLQVKRNCPALYDDIEDMFERLGQEKEEDEKNFEKNYGKVYSEEEKYEKNRDRYEYRWFQAYEGDGVETIWDGHDKIASVGWARQARIAKVIDGEGNDATPSLVDFLKNGSSRQPKPDGDTDNGDSVTKYGLISSRKLKANEMMYYKRQHWAIENSLHYVLDETFGEDRCTVRSGKMVMSVLRKCAYNIARLLQKEDTKKQVHIPDIIDKIRDDIKLAAIYIFKPKSFF